jgi:hypothetical protein
MTWPFNANGSYENKKQTVTSDKTFNSTTTPVTPDWALDPVKTIAGQIGQNAKLDPYSLIAPAHDLQGRAGAEAQNLSGLSWNFDSAADLMRGTAAAGPNTYAASTGQAAKAKAASLLENLDSYMSPYRRDVVDAALSDFDHSAGQTRAQQDLDLAASGAFGGSGAALTRSMTEDALTRGRASTSANLLDQMFQRGTALSADDANRRQQVSLANAAAANQFGLANMDALNAAGRFGAEARDRTLQRQMEAGRGLVDLSSAYDANKRANVETQATMGGILRDIDQQRRHAPITTTQQMVAAISGLPTELFVGSQTQGSEHLTQKTKSKGFSVGGSAGWGKA